MSSNVAIRVSPTTVKRRSLCGSSHERCRWAASPDGKRRKQNTTSSIAFAHVAFAARFDLVRLLAGEAQQRPTRRGRRATTARSRRRAASRGSGGCRRCSDPPSSPSSISCLSSTTPGWYSSRCPTISTLVAGLGRGHHGLGVGDDCAIGFSTKQCLPASSTRRASAAWLGTGVASATASTVSSASTSSRSPVKRTRGEPASATRARCSSEASQHHASSAPRRRAYVARDVRTPVAQTGDSDPQGAFGRHRRASLLRGSYTLGADKTAPARALTRWYSRIGPHPHRPEPGRRDGPPGA